MKSVVKKVNGSCFGDFFAFSAKKVTKYSTILFYEKALYNNANLNVIPIIRGKNKKVFVLTGPEVLGVVLLGNDYVLTFGKNNKLKSKKSIHNTIIPLAYNDGKKGTVSMYTHLKSTGKYITSTDICTIMLYKEFAEWKQHIVISKKNVSIWNCEKDELLIMSRKAWDSIKNN